MMVVVFELEREEQRWREHLMQMIAKKSVEVVVHTGFLILVLDLVWDRIGYDGQDWITLRTRPLLTLYWKRGKNPFCSFSPIFSLNGRNICNLISLITFLVSFSFFTHPCFSSMFHVPKSSFIFSLCSIILTSIGVKVLQRKYNSSTCTTFSSQISTAPWDFFAHQCLKILLLVGH